MPYLLKSANFFFQAEDGIRDRDVTGQTCALPISRRASRPERIVALLDLAPNARRAPRESWRSSISPPTRVAPRENRGAPRSRPPTRVAPRENQIGRASRRDRVQRTGVRRTVQE